MASQTLESLQMQGLHMLSQVEPVHCLVHKGPPTPSWGPPMQTKRPDLNPRVRQFCFLRLSQQVLLGIPSRLQLVAPCSAALQNGSTAEVLAKRKVRFYKILKKLDPLQMVISS